MALEVDMRKINNSINEAGARVEQYGKKSGRLLLHPYSKINWI